MMALLNGPLLGKQAGHSPVLADRNGAIKWATKGRSVLFRPIGTGLDGRFYFSSCVNGSLSSWSQQSTHF